MAESILFRVCSGFSTQLGFAIFAVCASFLLLRMIRQKSQLSSIPAVGIAKTREDRRKEFLSGKARNLYIEGYRKFKDGAFRIMTARGNCDAFNQLCSRLTLVPESECIVVSPNFLRQLKKLPDTVLSFNEAVEEALQTRYTKISSNIPTIPHTLKTSLNPALFRLNPVILDEVTTGIRDEFPQSSEWTTVSINKKLMRVVAKTSGRIFVGPGLCRDEVYLEAAVGYTFDMTAAIQAVGFISPWLRPIMASRLPQVKKLHTRFQQADAFLRPIVTARREAAKSRLAGEAKPDDMLQWLLDSQDKFGQQSDREISKYQLSLTFAAIHTTTVALTHSFYNLVAMPELVQILRDEIVEAVADTKGEITATAIQRMLKLDSFIKEIMRFYPQTATAFQRKVMKTFTLPNGQLVPAGTIIEVPSHAINYDETIYAEPEKFDALRFYNIRKQKEAALSMTMSANDATTEAAANNQFTSVSETSLAFGYGRNACPGRFFAANEIKMILATTILNYDLKMPDGCTARYDNLTVGSQLVPDPSKSIMMKLRNREG
ncbi:ent-kaurene oxidase [Colletotrichum truncatum]|uniref:Ent-kaurene oxidase n=1 Tax=Colletotrichum truncatum TaxID=5467 RepID=A0ACC3YXW0_COLTU